jgi:hypothetical protein
LVNRIVLDQHIGIIGTYRCRRHNIAIYQQLSIYIPECNRGNIPLYTMGKVEKIKI